MQITLQRQKLTRKYKFKRYDFICNKPACWIANLKQEKKIVIRDYLTVHYKLPKLIMCPLLLLVETGIVLNELKFHRARKNVKFNETLNVFERTLAMERNMT